MSSGRDTIFALSSGRPPAAIAVVRISGPRAGAALEALIGRIPPPREATLARVRDPQTCDAIDQALALWFPAPASETGEDTAELQLHGGRAVIAAVLAALGRIEGLRPAEAGEFTRRAFENGKLDLTAVEGLADLVMAETEAQRRQAFRQLTGALGDRAETWRQRLIEALALVEARIDFSDQDDVPDDLLSPALKIARELASEIETSLADQGRGERLREGLVVAIAGPPNAGKSTLLNRIARREAAIVSPYAGTTRDVIEVHLDLDGWPVTLLDTAGVRASDDPVEQEGVRRAQARAAQADLVLWLTEFGGPDRPPPAPRDGQTIWRVQTKVDLPKGKSESEIQNMHNNELKFRSIEDHENIVNIGLKQWSELDFTQNEGEFTISAVTGIGVETLIQALSAKAAELLGGREPALVTRDRHRRALQETLARLHAALAQTVGQEDLVAEELRLAARTLGRLTGRVDVEDILDVIFRDFCIGK